MNRGNVIHMMATMADIWPNFKPSETWPDTAEEMLADLPGPVVRSAIQELAMTHPDFAPGIGLIRKTAVEKRAESEGSAAPETDEAWEEVQRAIREVGRTLGQSVTIAGTTRTVTFKWSHPAIKEAVESFGWLTLCESQEPMADRAHFGKFYAAARERHAKVQRTTPTQKSIEASRPKELTR